MMELYIDDKQIQLTGSEQLALTYAIAPIGNIAERSGFRSTSFEIKPTMQNLDAFGELFKVQSLNVKPYRRLKARLYVGGIDQQVRFCEIKSVRDKISVNLYGGNTDFYTTIKERQLEDLDLSEFDHIWNVPNAAASRTNDEGYIYSVVQYGSLLNGRRDVNVKFTPPCFYEHTVIEEIIKQAGYTFEGSIFDDENYKRVIYPFTNEFPRAAQRWKDERYVKVKTLPETITIGDFTITTFSMGFDSVIEGNASLVNIEDWINQTINPALPAHIQFDQPHNYKMTLKVKFNITFWDPANSFLTISLGQVFSDGQFYDHLNNGTGTFEIELTAVTANALQFWEFQVLVNNIGITFESGTIEVGFSDESLYEADWNAEMNLLEVSQADLLKDWMNRNALLLAVNEELKTCKFFSYKDVENNMPNAVDWSDKVDEMDDPQITFTLDNYAQQTWLKYKDDDNVLKPVGTDGFITVDDQTLPKVTTIYTSLFAGSQMVDEFSDDVLVAAVVKFESEDFLTEQGVKKVKTEPRILVINRINQEDDIRYFYDTTEVFFNDNIPYSYFINPLSDAFNLGFGNNIIPLKYQELSEILFRAKIVKVPIRLDAADILNLDFSVPVWIEKHSAYFAKSQLEQYRPGAGESTIVELIKLG